MFIKAFASVLVLALNAYGAIGQESALPYLSFSLNPAGNGVLVTWRVEAGNTCQDVEIWRGTDSLNLSEVFTYAGICGDDDSSKVYSYTDVPPITAITYYYRIVVVTDKSTIKKITLPPKKGLSVYPNPANDFLKIISNPLDDLTRIDFYDARGNVVFTLEQPPNDISIAISHWPAGMYYYKARFKNMEVTDRIEVL
jgi:hypothetical protein